MTEKVIGRRSPEGIQEAGYVPIGGIRQWIQIRGEDRGNPVLLFLHGGPGASALGATAGWRPWERHFTVVQWDQRGSGRTYRENGESDPGSLTIDRMAADGIEVVRHLRERLGKDRILLVGHSWGSILGVVMAKRHPEILSAYVGTGQVVDGRRSAELRYSRVLARARIAGNGQAIAELEAMGPPPYDPMTAGARFAAQIEWAGRLSDGAGDPPELKVDKRPPDFTAEDRENIGRGMHFSRMRLGRQIAQVDLNSLGPDFGIPVFFFEGTEDQYVPIEPVEDYFRVIRAPHKELVRFEGYHHFFPMNRPDEFLAQLLARVRPLL
jgi:pimeloyl-ACP methyl ester carboxylesterase